MSTFVIQMKLRGEIWKIQTLVKPREMEMGKTEIKGEECVKSGSFTVLSKKTQKTLVLMHKEAKRNKNVNLLD